MKKLLEEILVKEWAGISSTNLTATEKEEIISDRGNQTLNYLKYCQSTGMKLSSKTNIKGHVISLNSSPRRTVFANNAEKAGLNYEFFDAVNGFSEDLNVFNLNVWGLQELPKQWESNKGHMACTLSHLTLYKSLYDSNDKQEWNLILEDDCYFHPYFSDALDDVIKAANEQQQDVDVIYISNRASHWFSVSENLKSKLNTMHLVSLDNLTDEITAARKLQYASQYSPKQAKVFGTEAILIRKSGLEKLQGLERHYSGYLLGEYLAPGPFGIEAFLQNHLGRSPSKSSFQTPHKLIEDGLVAENNPLLNSYVLTLPLTTTRDWLGESYFSETRRKRINRN
ncbi:glycosyltransferase family 25 protein [Paraglaciecola marina]|uniref:glycosyltransferase family 25 protein n=1 Tax=Paraglaciecola marina TaxID=2500157 RepID=UPI00105FEF36|nr:glycosyltransferase family 25 protein [Paraglaciecola marina]